MKPTLLCALLLGPAAWAQTVVKGPLSGNTTWSSGSYSMTGDVTVPIGMTLTIEPGVTITASASDSLSSGRTSAKVELIVLGTLRVNGTAQNPVVMTTSGVRGAWQGVEIRTGSTGSVVSHLQLEKSVRGIDAYGELTLTDSFLGRNTEGCVNVFKGGAVTVTGSHLSDCGVDAVFVERDTGSLELSYTLITSTGVSGEPDHAVNLHGQALLHHNTIANNHTGGIRVDLTGNSSKTVTLRDNIVYDNGSAGTRRVGSSGTVVFQNNNNFKHTSNTLGSLSGSGNITVDPEFVALNDYRLKASSPCRGVGTSGSDLGAFPYQGSPTVASVTVSPDQVTLAAGGKHTFSAVAKDSNGAPVAASITWSMAAAHAAAGLIAQNGELTAGTAVGVYPGAVVATAGGVSGTASVTIQAGAPSTIVITPTAATVAPQGTTSFSAQVFDANNTLLNVPVAWSMAVPAAGSVSASGVFTAGSQPGTFLNAVSASAGGLQAFADVTVNAGGLSQLVIAPTAAVVQAGGTTTFAVSGRDAHGGAVPVSATWAVVKGGGTISPAGVFTAGPTPGTYVDTIQASAGGLATTASVTVTRAPVAKVEVTPTFPALLSGESKQFTAVAKDAFGNEVPGEAVSWKVDAAAGSIAPSGLFTAGKTPGEYPNAISAEVGGIAGVASVRVLGGSTLDADAGTAADAGPQVEVSDGGTHSLVATPAGCQAAPGLAWGLGLCLLLLGMGRRRGRKESAGP